MVLEVGCDPARESLSKPHVWKGKGGLVKVRVN